MWYLTDVNSTLCTSYMLILLSKMTMIFLLCSVADDEFKQYMLMYMYFPFELIDSFDELQEELWCMISSMTSSFLLLK